MTRRVDKVESLLPPLKAESLQCLHRLVHYEPEPLPWAIPVRRQAAVAIILFVGRLGDLYVLLSTRAGDMRSYASDTALPGGKYEEGDADPEGTARREAYEEIGLPLDSETILFLGCLDIFLTGNGLLVTPVVLLVTDNTINPILNPSEVSHLFSMPLQAFLHSHPSKIPGWHYGLSSRSAPFFPSSSTSQPVIAPPPPAVPYSIGQGVVGGKEGRYYQYRDVPWGPGPVRMHQFLTGKEGEGIKPVYGLTSAILIHAASVGYDLTPDFVRNAPGQKHMHERIAWEVRNNNGPIRRAIEAEGLWDFWEIKPKAKL